MISNKIQGYNNFGSVMVEYKDYAIGGKMIIAKVKVPDEVMMKEVSDEVGKQKVRQMLVEQLADAIISNQLCEITQQRDQSYMDTIIAARCYVAPDSTIKLLRTLK